MDNSVNVMQFAEARASEIASLMHEVNSSDKKKTWFQRLPHYMRRRGASQNPKRVPRKLLEKNKVEKLNSKKAKHHKKKPPKNVKKEAENTWLKTHIWHAKRFKMETHWGYRLAIHSTDKKLGTCHRAAANHCMIQDLSYYCCIELRGVQKELISKLSSLCDASSGHTFASEMFLDGAKEGECFLYHPNSYPFEAIGPITFLWEPRYDFYDGPYDLKFRKLWIWCHPSFYDELVQVLTNLLETFECSNDNEIEQKHKTRMEMYPLKREFCRLRLIGPKSLWILCQALRVSDLLHSPSWDAGRLGHKEKDADSYSSLGDADSKWWEVYCKEEERNDNHAMQLDLWNSIAEDCQFPHYFPQRSVIGLTVRDPRCGSNWTKERSSAFKNIALPCKPSELVHLDDRFLHRVADSPLWKEKYRHAVVQSKLPEHLLNEERSKCIVAPDLGEKENRIPIIIIHRPDLNGFGSSFDLIAPRDWSLEFWRCLERNGALPAGLRDLHFVNLEAGVPNFPCSFPDTAASKTDKEALRSQRLSELKRRPKSQRPNFSALAIPSPFFMDWTVLVKEWELKLQSSLSPFRFSSKVNDFLNDSIDTVDKKEDTKTFYVLRRTEGLPQLCEKAIKVPKCSQSQLEEYNARIDVFSESSILTQTQFTKSLILVKIKCLNKGSPLPHAGVYLLNNEDFFELKKNPKFSGPTEPNHSEKKASQNESTKASKSLIGSSTRDMIGCLSEGGFSGIHGQGIGIGHCTCIGFLVMLKNCATFQHRPLVLWRNQHSFQYRFANVELIENYP